MNHTYPIDVPSGALPQKVSEPALADLFGTRHVRWRTQELDEEGGPTLRKTRLIIDSPERHHLNRASEVVDRWRTDHVINDLWIFWQEKTAQRLAAEDVLKKCPQSCRSADEVASDLEQIVSTFLERLELTRHPHSIGLFSYDAYRDMFNFDWQGIGALKSLAQKHPKKDRNGKNNRARAEALGKITRFEANARARFEWVVQGVGSTADPLHFWRKTGPSITTIPWIQWAAWFLAGLEFEPALTFNVFTAVTRSFHTHNRSLCGGVLRNFDATSVAVAKNPKALQITRMVVEPRRLRTTQGVACIRAIRDLVHRVARQARIGVPDYRYVVFKGGVKEWVRDLNLSSHKDEEAIRDMLEFGEHFELRVGRDRMSSPWMCNYKDERLEGVAVNPMLCPGYEQRGRTQKARWLVPVPSPHLYLPLVGRRQSWGLQYVLQDLVLLYMREHVSELLNYGGWRVDENVLRRVAACTGQHSEIEATIPAILDAWLTGKGKKAPAFLRRIHDAGSVVELAPDYSVEQRLLREGAERARGKRRGNGEKHKGRRR